MATNSNSKSRKRVFTAWYTPAEGGEPTTRVGAPVSGATIRADLGDGPVPLASGTFKKSEFPAVVWDGAAYQRIAALAVDGISPAGMPQGDIEAAVAANLDRLRAGQYYTGRAAARVCSYEVFAGFLKEVVGPQKFAKGEAKAKALYRDAPDAADKRMAAISKRSDLKALWLAYLASEAAEAAETATNMDDLGIA